MLPKVIENHTRVLGAPPGWDALGDGPCMHLAIRDTKDPETGLAWMVSVWEPEPKELERLAKGGSIRLFIQGSIHPIVGLSVTDPPE